jgi:hypothetical protein
MNPRRIVIAVLVVVATGFVVASLAEYLTFSRYVHRGRASADVAVRMFLAARAPLAQQVPLVEYRGFDRPVIHRTPEAPVHPLRTLRLLVYDPGTGELTRGAIPISVIRVMTLGGRLRVMNAGFMGARDLRVTLEDLERHGPGLVLDSSRGMPGSLAVADALLGTTAARSLLLVWTE